MASEVDYLQPAGGGVAVIKPGPSPAAAPAVRTPSIRKTSARDFSKDYGFYQGTVFDKKTNEGISSDDIFRQRTGVSSAGQKFDTSYIPPSVLASQNINKPITSSELEKSTNLPDVGSYVAATQGMPLSQKVAAVAATVFDSNKQILDQLQKDRQDLIAKEKSDAELAVKAGTDALTKLSTSTQQQDAQAAIFKRMEVEANIEKYKDIQTKIVGAQEALNMGLIYESDRPARMQLILGRSASLQKQGLATIGALQGTAAVLKGNIDLAVAYAKSTLDAIKEDNTQQYNALTTLLNLNSQKLVDLTNDEKDIVNKRIEAIGAEIAKQEKDKEDVVDLMTKYPDAFLSGGVTLLDSKETAVKKMLPKLAEKERTLFNLEVAAKNKALAGSGSGGSQADKTLLLNYKSNGMTYDEAITRFGDTLPVDYIASIYGRKTTDGSFSAEDALKNAYYGQYLNPDGSVKSGTSVSIDTSNGRPVVKQESSGGVVNWFKNLFK